MTKHKQTIESYLNGIVALLVVVLTGFYIANVNQPYYQDMNQMVLGILIATIILSLVPFAIDKIKAHKTRFLLASIVKMGLPAAIIFAGVQFLSMRVESFGYIFASNLEAGNTEATTAGTQAVLLLVLFVVTWLVSVLAAFISNKD
ncbi:MAG: hypothetical protein Q4B80_04840 [Aerococcaceae bacterium]|nr:hypothetical protein [Aerococcaceae bacterium]